MRVNPAMSLARSIRKTASMARWGSVAVMATDYGQFATRRKPG
jgi:hypothetical protein